MKKVIFLLAIMTSLNITSAEDVMLERKKGKASEILNRITTFVNQTRECIDNAETKIELKTCQRNLKLKIKNIKKNRAARFAQGSMK